MDLWIWYIYIQLAAKFAKVRLPSNSLKLYIQCLLIFYTFHIFSLRKMIETSGLFGLFTITIWLPSKEKVDDVKHKYWAAVK